MAAPALVSRLNDCRSCYKCIRACPTKSISFSDGHAQIVQGECVYCGRCYIACPQDCKIVRDDLLAAKRLVMEGEAYVSLAPSFQAAFPCTSFEALEKGLLDLGFKGVEETAVGATIVKKEYERLVKEGKEDILISTCCHSVNLLVEKHFPAAKKYLAPVLSPMLAHGLDLKKRHPGAKVVFVGPCISKKDEIDRYPGYVDCVLTFKEIKRWLGEKGIDLSIDGGVKKLDASRARLFPIEGGILKTMDKSEDNGYSYLAISGMERCIAALEDIIDGRVKKKVFIEMSACPGSCIAGPLVAKTERALISDYLAIEESAGKDDFKVEEIPLPELGKRFATLEVKQAEPSEEEIRSVLKKIGKNSPKDELNCSSCGYPTCRAKAIAVIRGKANLEMCLPYLMNKAESFSNTIVEQSENAIVVLSPSLSIVLANPRMASLLGAKDGKERLELPRCRALCRGPRRQGHLPEEGVPGRIRPLHGNVGDLRQPVPDPHRRLPRRDRKRAKTEKRGRDCGESRLHHDLGHRKEHAGGAGNRLLARRVDGRDEGRLERTEGRPQGRR